MLGDPNMKYLNVFTRTSFVLFVSLLCESNADLWKSPYIPENRTNVLEEWMETDKGLKAMTSSIIKSIMPRILESKEQINLTSKCEKELFQLFVGLRNLKKWAVQFVDSSAKMIDGTLSGSMSFFGNYEECVSTVVPNPKKSNQIIFQGQYCVADIRPPLPPKKRVYRLNDHLEALENFTGSEITEFLATKAHLFYFLPYKAGLCIPSGCSQNDLNQILSLVGKKAHLDIDVTHCEIKEAKKLYKVHVFAIVVCCILGSLVVLGTCLEMNINKKSIISKQIGCRILLCFSMITNFKRLVSTKSSADTMKCFHGFRFLSITWIVVGHSYFFPTWFIRSYRSLFQIQEVGTEIIAQMILNGSEAVDSFYFMSGCLLCYLTMKQVKVDKKRFDLKCFIFHRLWRIIPTYYFIILFAMLTPLMGSGPLFHETMMESIYPCYQYWWRNLLFINNFFNFSEMCMLHTWYVSCDMQLYLSSLLVILPLLRSEKIGLTINVAIIAISIIYSGVITAVKDLSPTVMMWYLDPEDRINGTFYTYANPLSRAGPYFLGIFVGYFLAMRPVIKIPKIIQVVGWSLAILSSGCVVFVTAFWFRIHLPSPQEVYAFAALFKVAFSAGVAWMIFCCITGHGGFINDLLSWKAWIPLSKLTFLIYLTQPILQNSYIANFQSTQEFTHFHFIMQFFGFICISSLLAMICNLLVESPFMAMEKMMRPAAVKSKAEEIDGETNNALSIEDHTVEENGNMDKKMMDVNTYEKFTFDSKL